MRAYYAMGQKVRFTARCMLTKNVPKNSMGYSYMALRSKEGENYQGEGIIEAGTVATIVDYASHATGSADNPIVLVGDKRTRCHPNNIEAI